MTNEKEQQEDKQMYLFVGGSADGKFFPVDENISGVSVTDAGGKKENYYRVDFGQREDGVAVCFYLLEGLKPLEWIEKILICYSVAIAKIGDLKGSFDSEGKEESKIIIPDFVGAGFTGKF
jgi:hypothetical protein